LNLIAEDAAYMLIIDSKLALSQVVLQSKQSIDLLEVRNNVAQVTRMQNVKDPKVANPFYLSLEADGQFHNRLEIKLRTSEGQQGAI